MLTIAQRLEEWVISRSLARHPNAVIKITPEALAELHNHWTSRSLPAVMTFMGIPLQVVQQQFYNHRGQAYR